MPGLNLKKYIIYKKLLDIVLSFSMLVVLFPLLIIVAILIRLDSKGPIIFGQKRIGKDGKEFTLYKFRSMIHGAEELKESLRYLDETTGPVFKIKDDPRITKIGRFIRKYSIDELPQLFNVLKRDMSLVGPRPLPVEEAEQYTPYQRRRLSVVPGLTCLWQISGRNELSFYEWIELDIYYIKHRSFLLDLKIIMRTIPVVVTGKGAY